MKGLGFLLKFAFRNLWRHPKRTLVMAGGLSFATGYIIFALNFAISSTHEMVADLLRQHFGSYQITAEGYYPNQRDRNQIDFYRNFSDKIVPTKDRAHMAGRVAMPAFISGHNKTLGLLLEGINPEEELRLTRIAPSILRGRFLESNDERSILIGASIAEQLGVDVGDEVAAIGQALDGSMANDLFKVVGILDFGGGGLERSIAFTSINVLRELLVMKPDHVHLLANFDIDAPKPSYDKLSTVVWQNLLPEVSVSVSFISYFTWIVSIMITIVICIGMSNSMMISLLERESEFNSLNIIGASSKWVTLSLVVEVFLMGLIGISMGVIIGHAVSTFFHYVPINLTLFTEGQPLMLGGMPMMPKVRLYPIAELYWKIPLMVASFLLLTLIWPVYRVVQRSRRADQHA